jgi:hypothetical protein
MVGITNLISELMLVFIFNSILNAEVSRTKMVNPIKNPQYDEKLIEGAESSSEDENLPYYGQATVFKQVSNDSVSSSDAMILKNIVKLSQKQKDVKKVSYKSLEFSKFKKDSTSTESSKLKPDSLFTDSSKVPSSRKTPSDDRLDSFDERLIV